MAWTTKQFDDPRELIMWLAAQLLKYGPDPDYKGWVWRGEPQQYPEGIVPVLERPSERDILSAKTYKDRLNQEIDWCMAWWLGTSHLRVQGESIPFTKGTGGLNAQFLAFARHHGCATRLVDWSKSPFTLCSLPAVQTWTRPRRFGVSMLMLSRN